MPKVEQKWYSPFVHNGMLLNNLIYKTTFSRRSDLWHRSCSKSESYYLDKHGVKDGSLVTSQLKFSFCRMLCGKQILGYCLWNVARSLLY